MKSIKIFDLQKQYSVISKDIKKDINKVLKSGQYILGKNVKSLENKIAKFLGINYAISCNSGTDALILSLKAQGINKGDEVITTPFTYFATIEAIIHVGAKPIFIDINPHTYNINHKKIENVITRKTRALLIVHLFGQSCNMAEIKKICKKNKLKLIEDCAQSFGAKFNNKQTGTFGDFGCFSFFPTKNLGCYGDGGIITTNSSQYAKKLQMLRNHGGLERNKHIYIGYNSRLDEIQAAILLVKLKYIKKYINQRRALAKVYSDTIDNNKIMIPFQQKKAFHTYNQYTIRTKNRNKLIKHLNTHGIPCSIYYPQPMYKISAIKNNYKKLNLKCCEVVSNECLSLPIYPEMDIRDAEYISNILNSFK